MQNEKLEYLGAGINAVVSDEHTFGTDAILLADFAQPKNKEKACDLGTGCGIIPLLWCRYSSPASVMGIDIQSRAVSQLQKAIEINTLKERITAVQADLRNLDGVTEFGRYDLVTMNPPYKLKDSGMKSVKESALIARHEVMCTLDDVTESAAKLLKYGGRFCICHRPERLGDVLVSMRKSGLEPKKLRLVVQRENDEPWLILAEGKKGGKPGMKIMPMLIMKNADGGNTEELNRIFGEYGEGH